MKVGGASGPLYGSLLLGMAAGLKEGAAPAAVLGAGVAKLKARGKSDVGAKTMLDVLVPVQDALDAGAGLHDIRAPAEAARDATRDMLAKRGRASFLGERSKGHVDPGAASAALLIGASATRWRGHERRDRPRLALGQSRRGHGRHGARHGGRGGGAGARGRRRRGRLGTDVAAIKAAIERVWSTEGVAVLVDLGSAEMGGEAAIDLLDESRRAVVRVCRAPLVEGAVVAATVADGGAPLDEVVAAAEAMGA